jgi:uncharacterized membrane protein
MGTVLIAYLTSAVVFLCIDAVWLRIMGDILYRPLLGEILLERFRVAPAILFYLIYIVGVVKFAVLPSLGPDRWITALFNGALLGLVAYGTYDLTNQATLKVWPTAITIADLCWGTVLTAIAALLARSLTNIILRALV